MRDISERMSVVVLTHDRREEAIRCVAELMRLPERPRIVVVDNASKDGTAETLNRLFPQARVMKLTRNLGAAGRNLGARLAATPYVAFCDDDAWWEPGSLTRAAQLLDLYPRLAVVSARVMIGPEGREDPSCGAMGRGLGTVPGLPGRATARFIAGACVMRRDAFHSAGGYEPRFFLGGEESLLAADLLSSGWQLAYVPDMIVHHHPSRRRDPAVDRKRLLMRNSLWFAWMRRPARVAVRKTVEALAAAMKERQLAPALLDAAKGLPWALRQRQVIPAPVEAAFKRGDE